jgi:hypothetical protein
MYAPVAGIYTENRLELSLTRQAHTCDRIADETEDDLSHINWCASFQEIITTVQAYHTCFDSVKINGTDLLDISLVVSQTIKK